MSDSDLSKILYVINNNEIVKIARTKDDRIQMYVSNDKSYHMSIEEFLIDAIDNAFEWTQTQMDEC